jgi:mannose-6-phosphate isomerase-like protein (cupin superfamily)
VLEGQATFRCPDGDVDVGAGHVVWFPPASHMRSPRPRTARAR